VSSSRPSIAFFGHFGWTNFGNEATLQAMLCNLRRLAPDAEFKCICTDPETVAADYNIAAAPSRRSYVRSYTGHNPLARWARKLLAGIPSEFCRWLNSLKTLRGVDALVVPGTGLLTDACGFFYWAPYDMFRWSVAAKLCGCKLLFVSVGAGPIYSRAGRFFIKTALSLADFRSYRDESSRQCLEGVGFPAGKDPVYPDLAFSLPATGLARARDNEGRRTVVGIGLMEYAGKYSIETRPSAPRRDYLETLVEFAEWLLAHDYDIRLLIGDLADTVVTQEFRSLLKERFVTCEDERIVDEQVASFQDVLSQIAATDFVVATRFHNILFSILLNEPTMAISFHHKCSSLMNQMGLADYCEDINSLKADHLFKQFSRLEQNATFLKRMIKEKVGECQVALDEQYGMILRTVWPERGRIAQPVTEIEPHPGDRVLS
jgi:polysaccharide pyruvyl transferase WcaK-like protein